MNTPAIYLTDPEEMRKARLNQPRMSREEARLQREAIKAACEAFSGEARRETSSRGHAKAVA